MHPERLAIIHRMIYHRQVILDWFDDLPQRDLGEYCRSLVHYDRDWQMRRTLEALTLCLERETALAFRPPS